MGAVDTSLVGGQGDADKRSSAGQSGQQEAAAEAEAKPSTFAEVLKAEWAEVRERREEAKDRRAVDDPKARDNGSGGGDSSDPELPPSDLAGLALSGGGIRSATFCLGLLQGLNRDGTLKKFDYLSTVSGGGYTGGWWSAWLARTETAESAVPDPRQRIEGDGIFPPREKTAPVAGTMSEFIDSEVGDADAQKATWGDAESRRIDREYRRLQHELDLIEDALKSVNSESYRDRASAGNDPVHHLRLFGNYLTPRKGALSADTWRAITIISRNLLLTWLLLLPLLVALILAAQLFFIAQPALDPPEMFYSAAWKEGRTAALGGRLWIVAWTALGYCVLLGLLICSWMVTSGDAETLRKRAAGWAGAVIVGVIFIVVGLAWLLWPGGGSISPRPTWGWALWVLAWGGFLIYALWLPDDEAKGGKKEKGRGAGEASGGGERLREHKTWRDLVGRRRELRRGRIVRTHSAVLMALAATMLLLLFAGFGHELVNFLRSPAFGVPKYVAQAGGWIAVLSAVAGSIYTALMTAPSGGRDAREVSRPSVVGRIVLTVTPPLVLVVLAVGASWALSLFMAAVNNAYVEKGNVGFAGLLSAVTCFGIVLAIYFALAEARWFSERTIERGRGSDHPWKGRCAEHKLLVALTFVLGALAVWLFASRLWDFIKGWYPGNLTRGPWQGWLVWAFLAGAFAVCLLAAWLLLIRSLWSEENKKPLALLSGTLAVTLVIGASVFFLYRDPADDAYGRWALLAHTSLVVIGALVTWVLAFGWMADPNALSLHLFYKARLVRAYLGASNLRRGESLKSISESVEGDDVPLHLLKNCQRGAPYHLINTTLNLVGARDLATAQRSSDYFVMSKRYCGSARTGYRRTEEYMRGHLSLGTAVAVSGAAASPSMGAMTFSAPLVMLMTLLNVRLGFWAPTPNKPGWRETAARFWPYYTLRELFSQTNDLSAYCNLSDGGHFDNTALYSLVARACRLIVLADCGADPRPSFSDLGTAIRRCRIDFNADIQIDIKLLERAAADGRPGAAYAVGDITYDQRHLRALFHPPAPPPADATDAEKESYTERYRSWEEKRDRWVRDKNNRTGRIYVVKPGLTGAREESADVRQYGMMNEGFPQQSTADFWYDEAQFESYRRLGQHCAGMVSGPISSFGKEAEVNLTTVEYIPAP